MGIKRAEFFRMTPLDFDRHLTAFAHKRDVGLLPLRRLETALWNVQIAKTEKGKQIEPTALYGLRIDTQPLLPERSGKQQADNGIMSKAQFLALMQQHSSTQPTPEQ